MDLIKAREYNDFTIEQNKATNHLVTLECIELLYFGIMPSSAKVVWPTRAIYLTYQCDQIGLFLKDLGCKFCFRSRPNIWFPSELFWRWYFVSKNCFGFYLGNVWTNLAFLMPTSGHAVTYLHRTPSKEDKRKEPFSIDATFWLNQHFALVMMPSIRTDTLSIGRI